RPLNLLEQRKLYLRGGRVWVVEDEPTSRLYRFVRRPPAPRVPEGPENCPPNRPSDLPYGRPDCPVGNGGAPAPEPPCPPGSQLLKPQPPGKKPDCQPEKK